MILLSKTESPSEHVRLRAQLMKVEPLAHDLYIVVPEPGKAQRMVHMDVSSEGEISIECVDNSTGDLCMANKCGKHCAHVEAAVQLLHEIILEVQKMEQCLVEGCEETAKENDDLCNMCAAIRDDAYATRPRYVTDYETDMREAGRGHLLP